MWHFNDNNDESYANDRLRKISPLIKKLNQKFEEVLTPGTNVCIDETMVPFRGCLIFKQFLKNKHHKFGIKLYKLCTEKGYTYNIRVYSGTDALETGSASQRVVIEMMNGLLDCGRTLFTDKYYTSVVLATELLERKTHLVGTIRSNRKFNSNAVVAKKLQKYEIFAQEATTAQLCSSGRTREMS
ncbi:hypothetical protein NQ314_007981 [Rhamnusium bicolor]|uniref:PiggyBac transposable element-derived protein domain-containing protein n=1 Tax=Rhamnusium bicolor TaxID=1586634 RepID=A0AAV8YI41_9CUCU|nr:hypothetical protein NQ314_007981 [Rhamnusium bicolor]